MKFKFVVTQVGIELIQSKGRGEMEQQNSFSLSTCPDELSAAIELYPNCPTEVNIGRNIW